MVCEKSKKVESDIFQNTSSSGETSCFTAKELDEETGLYYYGARYLNPRTSRWISADPALEDYIPVAPVDDEARRHNQNLPGMGGVFNPLNLNPYHYSRNNPVKYNDPDGKETRPYPQDGASSGVIYRQDSEMQTLMLIQSKLLILWHQMLKYWEQLWVLKL